MLDIALRMSSIERSGSGRVYEGMIKKEDGLLGIGNLIGKCTGHLSRLWLVELKPTLDILWTSEGKLKSCRSSKVKGNADVGKTVMKGLMSEKISVGHTEQYITCITGAIDVQDLGK